METGKQAPVDDAAALLRQAGSVLLLCHQKPDGDTLGRFRNLLIRNEL